MKTRAKNRRNADARRLRFETLEPRRLLAVDLAPTNPEFAESASAVEIVETGATDRVVASETVDWYLLSSTLDATPQEQELYERINRFRADPAGELDRIFSSITDDALTARNSLVNDALAFYQYPRNSIETFLKEWAALEAAPPLAINAALDVAAATHNRAMISSGDVSHQTSGEKSLSARVVAAGFESGLTNEDGSLALGENVGGSFAASGSFSVASFIFEAFAVDWGVPEHSHRDAFMNAAFTEIGVSISTTRKAEIGPNVATTDLGTSVLGARTDGAYLLGSVFDDLDRDLFYDAGEGIGGATLKIERLDGSETPPSVEITSATAGGYQIFLANGTYRVTVEGEGFASPVTKTVSINDGVNAKLDFRTSDAGAAPPVVDLNGDDAEGTGFSAVFVEGSVDSAEVLATSKLTISDADSAFLYGATIQFANRPDGVEESLDASVAGTNLRASFDEQGGLITLSGVGTLQEYEDAIASLTYFNAKDLCELTDRVVTISVFDGVYWSEAAELTISVKPTNLPNMTVQEAFVYEGDEGSTVATFVVELDAPARLDVAFNYRVALGGTATEGETFVVPIGDPKAIAQGETTATIVFYVLGNYDALKPEGLAAVEGGYENPATDFFLEIVDLENAYLTNENALVKGTIYDDDSPIILGTVDEYEFAGTLDTDGGKRRYVFTVTPETSGYFAWKADLAASPTGLTISTRPGSLEAEPLELSEATENGQRVQWFADPAVEYWVVVEAAADFNAVAAKLLPIDENNVARLDGVLDDATEELLEVFWDGAEMDVVVDDFAWSFGADSTPFGTYPTLQTDFHPDAAIDFWLAPEISGSVATSDAGTTWTDDAGGSTSLNGFGAITYRGGGVRENVRFSGTNGDDFLYYANGSGYFETSAGKTYRFENVDSVVVDGGSAGRDVARIEDTAFADSLKTTNAELNLSGGGFSLVAKNFTDARIAFVNGGEDSFYATDSGDDVAAVVAKRTAMLSGTFGGDGTTAGREYVRIATNVAATTFEPETTLGALSVIGDDSSGTSYVAEIGSLTVLDLETNATTTARNVKSLKISGVPESAADRFEVVWPEDLAETSEDESHVSCVDSKGWKLSTPLWKKAPFSAANLDGEPTAAERDDAFFAEIFNDWNEFDDGDAAGFASFVDALSFDAASVFEILDSLSDEQRKRRSFR